MAGLSVDIVKKLTVVVATVAIVLASFIASFLFSPGRISFFYLNRSGKDIYLL
jgi:hypothetical protein